MSIRNALEFYKQGNFRVFTSNGLLLSLILIVIFAIINLIPLNFNLNLIITEINVTLPGDLLWFLINVTFSIICALFTISIWWILGIKFAPKVGYHVVENNILRLLLIKNSQCYFEKLSESERKINATIIFNKLINLLIVWLSIVAFLIGVILPFLSFIFPASANTANSQVLLFLQSSIQSNGLIYLVKILLVMFIAPLLLTIVIPIPWMLIDSQLKGYLELPRINFFIGSLIQQKLASLFAIGGLISLILSNINLQFIISFIIFIFLFISLPAVLVTFLYNLFFQISHYQVFMQEIPVPYGNTQVIMEAKVNTSTIKPTNSENISSINPNNNLEDPKSSQEQ